MGRRLYECANHWTRNKMKKKLLAWNLKQLFYSLKTLTKVMYQVVKDFYHTMWYLDFKFHISRATKFKWKAVWCILFMENVSMEKCRRKEFNTFISYFGLRTYTMTAASLGICYVKSISVVAVCEIYRCFSTLATGAPCIFEVMFGIWTLDAWSEVK